MRFSAFVFLLILSAFRLSAQGNIYSIKNYDVNIQISKDGVLDVTETLDINFHTERHGIIRAIPAKYHFNHSNADSSGIKYRSDGHSYNTYITDVQVSGHPFSKKYTGDYLTLKIGSPRAFVSGDHRYVIHYKIHGAINFFQDKSEFYFNIIGHEWDEPIEKGSFQIQLHDNPEKILPFFVASGPVGSQANITTTAWASTQKLSGTFQSTLQPHEGITVGIAFPADFLIYENYANKFNWLLFALPAILLGIFYGIWTKWGKDYSFSLQTEFYPPEGINPSIAGYLIDDKLDKKDLTALIPYWGQKGFLSLKETTHKDRSIFSKKMDYTFSKVKELDSDASEAEKTIFNGIFEQGPQVNLSDLKERFYVYMKIADSDIRHQVDSSKYYYESSNIWKWLMLAISILLLTGGLLLTFISFGVMIPMLKWIGLGMALGAIAGFIIFQYMPKKTIVGTDIYKKLVGFKEFISKVEKDKLEFFLKQDPAYFDKVLPYAIVFNQADLWKKKFKDLEIDPPQWYVGSTPNVYYYSYLNDLDRGLNEMSSTFYSTPQIDYSASSGSSWSSGGGFGGGGGGFSGGGFGGGGGSSW